MTAKSDQLLVSLTKLGAGLIPENNIQEIENLLVDCWDDFSGSSGGGMDPSKLIGRTEELRWEPPCLTFKIERHGGAKLSSSRAEMQSWSIDLESRSASFSQDGYRQLRPNDKPLDARQLAEEIARLIRSGEKDDRLEWQENGSVKVLTGKIVPTTNKQTTANRRTRFTKSMISCLSPEWECKNARIHLIFERMVQR